MDKPPIPLVIPIMPFTAVKVRDITTVLQHMMMSFTYDSSSGR